MMFGRSLFLNDVLNIYVLSDYGVPWVKGMCINLLWFIIYGCAPRHFKHSCIPYNFKVENRRIYSRCLVRGDIMFSKNCWKLTHTSQKWYTPHTRCMSTDIHLSLANEKPGIRGQQVQRGIILYILRYTHSLYWVYTIITKDINVKNINLCSIKVYVPINVW